MRATNLLIAVIYAAAFMLSTSFVMYVTSIVIPYIRHRPIEDSGDPVDLDWHIVIPSRDEDKVIEATVVRLRKEFPSAHLWCIDDASVDQTGPILARLARRDPKVHVVTRRLPDARTGKGPALNSAWRAVAEFVGPQADTDRVIFGVVDADGRLDPDCLKVLSGSRYFGDPSISAVQIQVRVANSESGSRVSRALVRLQDMEFTSTIAAIQMLRRSLGSVGMGGNGQFTRLSSLNAIGDEYGEPWQKALIEDFELGLHVLMVGGRNEYCHETAVWQQGPPTFGRLVRQRSRWGQGVMQCRHYLKQILGSPKVQTGAALEISYFLALPWMQVIGDAVYVFALSAFIYGAVTVHGGFGAWMGQFGGWQVVPVFVLFGLGPFLIWGPLYRSRVAPELKRWQALGLGLANWPYVMVHHCAAWWAFTRTILSHNDWKKTERQAERAPALVVVLAGRIRFRSSAAPVAPAGAPLVPRTTVPARLVIRTASRPAA